MRLIIILYSLFSLVSSFAQQTITGVVTDEKNQPLPGVNVYIKDTYDGATTDEKGKFSFSSDEKGKHELVSSFLGYETITQPIDMDSKQVLNFNIKLKETVNELSIVTITAGSFEASDERKVTVLKPLDIVTTAGANGDTYSALKTLPGAQQIGETEGLFVRGGTGAETQTFIDGMLVDKPFFSSTPDIAQRGRFSPFLFKGTLFSTGGYSALYGQGLSGALILETLDIPERSASTLALSSVGIGTSLFKLFDDKKACIGGDINYTDLTPYFALVNQKQKILENPRFIGGSAFYRQKTGKTGMIKFYGYYNYGQFSYAFPNLDDPQNDQLFSLHNGDLYTNLSYKSAIGDKWSMQSGISFSDNYDKLKFGAVNSGNILNSFNVDNKSSLTQARTVLTRYIGRFSSLRSGVELQNRNSSTFFGGKDYSNTDLYSALFSEAEVYITTRIAARIGLRAEHSSLVEKYNIAPRASFAYKVSSKTSISLAAGQFFQQPPAEYSYLLKDKGYSNATHYIANVQSVSNDYTFRSELFYKKYSDLIKTAPDTALSGSGYAQGIEFFWRDKRTLKFVDYWVSYSYLDTKRNWLDFPISTTPSFAADHTVNLVFKKFFTKIKTNLSATYTFASGRPYFNPNRPDNEYLKDRTANYNALGLSASYLTTVAKAFTVIVFSVTNVTGAKQVFGYRYSTDGTIRSEINPPAPRFFFIGMFMSWGIDRTQDVLDKN